MWCSSFLLVRSIKNYWQEIPPPIPPNSYATEIIYLRFFSKIYLRFFLINPPFRTIHFTTSPIWDYSLVKKTCQMNFQNDGTNRLENSLKQSLSLLWCSVTVSLGLGFKKASAISSGPWLTVVPTQPCRTICKIFESTGSWCVAFFSSSIFFWRSSIATSTGCNII